ncbi:MAG: hypothetical protein GY943_27640 [Chloroflexi bacterium]|nr:hypothetical protein [Chloroflexota bacterium]
MSKESEHNPFIDVETIVNNASQEFEHSPVLEMRTDVDGKAGAKAPKAPPITRLREYLKELSKLKQYFIGGLTVAFLLILVTQFIFRTFIVPNEFDGGPLPLPLAIEQLGSDFEVPTPPPVPTAPPPLPTSTE